MNIQSADLCKDILLSASRLLEHLGRPHDAMREKAQRYIDIISVNLIECVLNYVNRICVSPSAGLDTTTCHHTRGVDAASMRYLLKEWIAVAVYGDLDHDAVW